MSVSRINWGFSGIYDHRTMSFLKEKQIRQFGFDFRPRSMNFLQGYRFLELLEAFHSSRDKYFLHFSLEKDFVIKKILQDISNFLNDDLLRNQFTLLFSDDQETAFYEQFKVPFYWCLQENNQLSSHVKSPYCKGVVIPYMVLESYYYEGTLQGLLQTLSTFLLGRGINIVIEGHWQMELIPDIMKYLRFESFWCPIDHDVELCYRNVDFPKLMDHWERIQGIERLLPPQLNVARI